MWLSALHRIQRIVHKSSLTMNGPWLFLRVMGLVGSKGACLPNATAEVDRRDLVNVAGESYSIGLWKTGNYAAAHLATAVVQIMVEEGPTDDPH